MLRAELVLGWVRGPSVLDVGCAAHVPEPGSPYWVHGRLREKFPQVSGLDISERNIDFLRQRGFDNLFVANAETFTLPGKFDTVFSGELIEHLSNPAAFLDRAKHHLAEGGRVVLTTPYPFALLYQAYAFMKFPKTCQNPEHTCWFCPQTLTVLAERVGMRVVHWELVEDYRLDDPSWKYRMFVRLVRWFRWLIPRRIRNNTLVCVLEPAGAQAGPNLSPPGEERRPPPPPSHD
ncbi:MAG TPA: class I SAM-dependent methyltransferase [Planctomycetota bacterium]|nr:class I SAM-dependent methyltransferase [Planctomycetota bacterium]